MTFRFTRFAPSVAAILAAAIALPSDVGAQTYRFNRYWPVVQQPWIFLPQDIELASDGTLLVSDTVQVVRMNRDGIVLSRLRSRPPDPSGSVNVLDMMVTPDDRIVTTELIDGDPTLVVSDLDGTVLETRTGTDAILDLERAPNGQFVGYTSTGLVGDRGIMVTVRRYDASLTQIASFPIDRAVEKYATSFAVGPLSGDLYFLSGDGTRRVLQYSPQGTFIREWATPGGALEPALGEQPDTLVADPQGRLWFGKREKITQPDQSFETPVETYVYSASGQLLDVIDGEPAPQLILADGRRYAKGWPRFADIEIRDANGATLQRFGVGGDAPGRFGRPLGIDVGLDDSVYVADFQYDRVQRFSSSGGLISSFGTRGGAAGQFKGASQVKVLASGDVLVGDGASRIQRFTAAGAYVSEFTVRRTVAEGPPLFYGVFDVAANGDLLVPVIATSPGQIWRFSPTGQFLGETNLCGIGLCAFPSAVAIAPNGNVWVHVIPDLGSLEGRRVSRLSSSLSSILCSAPIERPIAEIRVVGDGTRLAMADVFGPIERVDNACNRLTPIGRFGATASDFYGAVALAEDSQGRLFVAQDVAARVTRFDPGVSAQSGRAIVVAGGGPYPGNSLWGSTQVAATFAVQSLANQGYDNGTTTFLSAGPSFDLDGNGVLDDVDGAATAAALQQAILGPNASTATDLVLYLVDHGGDDTFRLSAIETLDVATLDGWLDQWQAAHPTGRVIVVYDACLAGSFLDDLAAPRRFTIASTDAASPAYFVSQGTLSFSSQFWSQVMIGQTLKDAFVLARDATQQAFDDQVPQLDADGDGIGNEAADLAALDAPVVFIGNGTPTTTSRPLITSLSAPQTLPTGSSTTLTAFDVTDPDGMNRVWAVLRPPGFQPIDITKPVQELVTVDLSPIGGNDFAATYDGFFEAGTYQIVVHAVDQLGNYAVPKVTTVSVQSPLRRRAVVVVGGSAGDGGFADRQAMGDGVVAALEQQGYGADGSVCANPSCDDVMHLVNAGSATTDVAATLANLDFAITDWGANGVGDLTVAVVGARQGAGVRLSSGEELSAAQLDAWLDEAQAVLPGTLTVVLDVSDAGTVLRALSTPAGKRRIVIASAGAGKSASTLVGGTVSYSSYFWNRVLDGATVQQAHTTARNAMSVAAFGQVPELEDSGDSVPNQSLDGRVALRYSIGSGIVLAGDEPLIASVSAPGEAIPGGNYALQVSGVTTTGTIAQVTAVVVRAGGATSTIALTQTSPGTWGASVPAGTAAQLPAQVAVVAIDDDGDASAPAATEIRLMDVLFRSGFE